MVCSLVFQAKRLEKVHNSCIRVCIIGMLGTCHAQICIETVMPENLILILIDYNQMALFFSISIILMEYTTRYGNTFLFCWSDRIGKIKDISSPEVKTQIYYS